MGIVGGFQPRAVAKRSEHQIGTEISPPVKLQRKSLLQCWERHRLADNPLLKRARRSTHCTVPGRLGHAALLPDCSTIF
jgi:hypothetical protein